MLNLSFLLPKKDMTEILNGKDLAAKLKASMAEEVALFPAQYGRAPHLAVILVGDNPASATYVRNKAKASEVVGIRNTTITFPQQTTQKELLKTIEALNNDDSVDGILIQLPLPPHFDEMSVIKSIKREKDVDGFHPYNVADLWQQRAGTGNDFTIPCTPKGIIRMLKNAGVELDGKNAVVVGRSNIVGLPVAKLLLNENATVTICHTHTRNLGEITRNAEILIVAVGAARLIKEEMVGKGAVVIDVGMNRDENGKLCGDVDFENVAPKCSLISPVPGGVGPMTICCLMENTIECFLRKIKNRI